MSDGKIAVPEGPGLGLTPKVDELRDAFPVRPHSSVDALPPFYIGAV